ncbi:flagellar basal body rod protein FlgG [Aneurinibacillus tyrosinisolvens]|uniref:flagellar basal body rod protein FlgG n=1 Tax=Aneurinibacillus tyrosinisolvens TaxID=1443435 RepID=UPI00063F811A|nr:flagellar basal body rod protein FlgG [Aneurinibacillus tyrosinisolvens]
MLRSLYSGVAGMRGFQTKLDVIGNNIANVNTVGYKKSRVMFQDILSQTVAGGKAAEAGATGGINGKQIGLGSTVSSIDVIHTPGSPQVTNVGSDLSIHGNGFFVVRPTADAGEMFLTRAGNFTIDAANQLVTSSGMLVVDEGGAPITLPDGTKSYSIAPDGTVNATDEAGQTTPAGKIGIALVQNPGGLEKVGGSLYRATPASDVTISDGGDVTELMTKAGTRGDVIAGELEMSNVDLAEEFTEMIITQRGFQANSRIITTSDSILEELVNLKR